MSEEAGSTKSSGTDSPRIDVLAVCGVKSASTWLARFLEGHDSIVHLRGQDLIFDFDAARLVGFRKEVRPQKGQLVISRRNLSAAVLTDPYAEAFYRHNPEMRFIALLREPFSRTFSNIRHTVGKYPLDQWPESFRKASRRTGFGRLFLDPDALFAQELEKPLAARHTVGVGSLYRSCLEPFVERFPKERFLILPIDKDMKDMTRFIGPVLDYLDLPPSAAPAQASKERVNVAKSQDVGLMARLKGFREVEIGEPSAACLEALRGEFLADARRLDADFGTNAVDTWELETSQPSWTAVGRK